MADPSGTRLTTLSRSVAGRAVIVTGAASGMGRATAHLFADEGARVAVADLGGDRVAEVIDEITSAHGDGAAIGVVTDVADPEEVAHMTLNLCLPSASYVNGAVIAVDGGMTIRHT